MNKRISITIGIATYNAEKNINTLLNAVFFQKIKGGEIEEIIVHLDKCTDNTLKIVQGRKNKKTKLINSNKRQGFAQSIIKILRKSTNDIVVLLNDDIKITDKQLIHNLIKPFLKEKKVGLVSDNPQPLEPKTFIEKSVISTFKAYKRMRYEFKSGNNKYTCDGKILALSKFFVESIDFPKNRKEMGNVDTYLYLSCLKNGFKYRHVRRAKVFYRCPTTIEDYINLTVRNNSNSYLLKKRFGELVNEEYNKPNNRLRYYMLLEFLKNPLGCLFTFICGIYCKLNARFYYQRFSPTWSVVKSTKNLI